MKKVILALAAAMFASCSNEETILVAQPDVIGFGTPFIENATRAIDPSYGESGAALTEFSVWGTVKGNGEGYAMVKIFDGDTVTGKIGPNVWSCDNAQYWAPSCDYNFVALTDIDAVTALSLDDNGMPQGFTYSAATNADIMVAKATASTNENATPNTNYVNFTFQHLLSKVKFTFATESAGAFKIKDVKISGFYASGNCDITSSPATWKGQTGSISDLSFGNANNTTKATDTNTAAENITATNPVTSNYEHLIIPGTYAANSLSVSFTKEYYLSASDTSAASTEVVSATLPALTAQPNNAYNILVNLEGGSQITFHINAMEEWGPTTEVNPEQV